MEARPITTVSLVIVLSTTVTGFWFTPRGPQIYSCLTYTEKNLRVDCEFPLTEQIPGPYCEFKQDGKIIGTTYPNTPSYLIPTLEVRRRANVSLVSPTICRLTWAPMADERSYSYTCRVYQGSSWKENSMAFHQRNMLYTAYTAYQYPAHQQSGESPSSGCREGNVLMCSAISIISHSVPWLLGILISLPVSLGSLSV